MVFIPAALAVFFALSSLALTLLFAAHLRIPGDRPPDARVALVLPLTGSNPGLEALLDALAAQSLRPRRLIVIVESRNDPAHDRIKAFGGRYANIEIELLIAGLSPLRSQKCTNLLRAIAALDDAPYIVFFDADIRPQPWWLAALVAPLTTGQADIVNGYRWLAPQTASLASTIFAGIDRVIATLPRISLAKAIWGGSLAVTHHALETLDLPQIIGRALTEDLPIGVRAADIGLRVLTRRALRAPTPLDDRFHDLWRFGRRQYQLIRIYRPGLWSFAAFVVTTDVAARLALLLALTFGGASAISVAALIAIAALGSTTVELRSSIGRKLNVRDPLGMRWRHHLLTWIIVPLPAAHASVIWGGLITSPVRWAHIRYIVDRRGRVTDIVRHPHSDQSA